MKKVNKDTFLQWCKNPQVWGFAVSVVVMAIVSLAFFAPANFNGATLQQHDMQQGTANGQEATAYQDATGEKALWTNALFSGMPTFQISPEYPSNSLFTWLNDVYGLGLPAPSNLMFMMMAGMLIMCYCMKMRWWYALIAALGWGLSSYFVIIIGAGHIWKFTALTYMPPTIGAVIMAYRAAAGRRGRAPPLSAAAILALFAMLELNANHPQITYYSLFIMAALGIAFLIEAIRKKTLKTWGMATVACLAAGVVAVGANAPSLYNTYEYSKETKRAGSELTALASDKAEGAEAAAEASDERPTGGLPKAEIGGWSNTPSESFSLLIPNVKGGATIRPEKGNNEPLTLSAAAQALDMDITQEDDPFQLLDALMQYFGGKGLTNGPFYFGALLVALFLLGALIVRGPVKWAFVTVTVFSIFLAMGNHFEALTDFMIYNVPLYNKFRAAETALVIAALCVPVLGVMGLARLFSEGFEKYKAQFAAAFGVPLAVAVLFWLAPSVGGEPIGDDEAQWLEQAEAQIATQQPENLPYLKQSVDTVCEVRLAMVSADAGRSVLILLLGAAVVFAGARWPRYRRWMVAATAVIVVVDLYSVDKRYVSEESFLAHDFSADYANPLAADSFDNEILADKGYYRVMDIPGFGDARRSFYHHMVGGYHAAKLNRYNDLIERRMNHVMSYGYVPELRDSTERARYGAEYQGVFADLLADYHVLDMLNARYVINPADAKAGGAPQLVRNEGALGAAWLVGKVKYVDNADAEMAALATLDPAAEAVADRRFSEALGQAPSLVPGDTVLLKKYTPNTLTYSVTTRNGGIAVFSEVWFPWGWKATIDGNPAPLARVNYVLRAMRVPAGTHTVVMTFDPDSLHTTGAIAYACVSLIYLLVLLALFCYVTRRETPGDAPKAEPKAESSKA